MSDYLVKAIKYLHPEAEFSFQNNDYSTIKWDVLNGEAPTQSEITKTIEKIKADEVAAEAKKAADKAAILERLGITEDEAKLLLS